MSAPFTLLVGDAAERLRELADASVDSVLTDPPYGLSAEPDIVEVLTHWLAGDDYKHRGGGFMGRSWDSFVPGPAVWREVFRVLKPGGHVLAFSGTRTYDLAVIAMRIAGFEVRDQCGWMYGSGMPKNRKLGEGWGTALKPAWEPLVLARKPFKGSTMACRFEHGTGGLNIEACRVPLGDETLREGAGSTWNTMHAHEGRPSDAERYRRNCSGDRGHDGTHERAGRGATDLRTGGGKAAVGRWPANLMHDGSAEVLEHFPDEAGGHAPVTGNEPSSASTGHVTNLRARVASDFIGDAGSAARFFYCAKASTAEREAGCEALAPKALARSNGAQSAADREPEHVFEEARTDSFNAAKLRRNHHSTVKPLDLCRYFLRLITPPGGTTLDPFAGSGSIGAAAVLEGFKPIMIELDLDDDGVTPMGYADIIRARQTWAWNARMDEERAAKVAAREAEFRANQKGLFA